MHVAGARNGVIELEAGWRKQDLLNKALECVQRAQELENYSGAIIVMKQGTSTSRPVIIKFCSFTH